MAITDCPMCHSPIPTGGTEPIKTCASCGADLGRWMPKPPKPPPLPASQALPRAAGEFNLGLGIVGALAGACIGAGVMYAFFALIHLRFPLLGVGIGLLTGFGAKLLYKGTDNTLGMISGGIAMVAVVGTLFLMYGTFPIISIVSVVVSVSVAYRIASG